MSLAYRIIRRVPLRKGFNTCPMDEALYNSTSQDKMLDVSEDPSNRVDSTDLIPIYGVIFDMDGTLTQPVLDFVEMRRQLGIPSTVDIMQHVSRCVGEERTRALNIIEKMENDANASLKFQSGLLQLLNYLQENKIRKAILTRNSQHSLQYFLDKLSEYIKLHTAEYPLLCSCNDNIFSECLSRDFEPQKPNPAPVLHICKQWSLSPCNILLVGDGKTDIISGHSAGTVTVFLDNTSEHIVPEKCPCDKVVHSLVELFEMIQTPFVVERE